MRAARLAPVFAVLMAVCLTAALVLDISRTGGCAAGVLALVALVFLGLAVAFPHWPRRR